MTWGPNLHTLYEMQEVTGVVPKALQERPTLHFALSIYVEAFFTCSKTRKRDMAGALAIELTEILAYCELLYIKEVWLRENIMRAVQSMDSKYLEIVAKKTESAHDK